MTEQWTSGPEGLRFGSLLVSFQRFERPPGETLDTTPRSLGALPVGAARSEFFCALRDDEAFWIGIISSGATPPTTVVMVSRCDGTSALAARIERRPIATIPGIVRENGKYDALCRSTVTSLSIDVHGSIALVKIVAPDIYESETGLTAPGPLDLRAAYGGWRLP